VQQCWTFLEWLNSVENKTFEIKNKYIKYNSDKVTPPSIVLTDLGVSIKD
jgi:hypothetical protein